MTHSLIPKIIDLATPIGEKLGLEVIEVVFLTNRKPPVLRIFIRNLEQDTSLDDCEKMSRAIEEELDATETIPEAYVLEISSPGTNRELKTDREFMAFRGFSVIVSTYEPDLEQKEWRGKLQQRSEKEVVLNLKGREYAIPRALIAKVQLDDER
ncbi:MAG: ribosome maturation factor RimP [Gomphosphaeria aponina SAG 52.96 = DSM 107014]|uniref:Ribosome maturation factor RimP n=1 Tax=Gomphosphaeria aponina SAG 52.96 = DSM 107014 TaxID=1521640 RepID=A0A941GUH5_9CHRO|nr:ribosome maturation factor RimP [Gomphosphaeria aponina SAG 52.96 = DSM 107014]